LNLAAKRCASAIRKACRTYCFRCLALTYVFGDHGNLVLLDLMGGVALQVCGLVDAEGEEVEIVANFAIDFERLEPCPPSCKLKIPDRPAAAAANPRLCSGQNVSY
jgi:hypothetical protein